MALQALAKYRDQPAVAEAIEEALTRVQARKQRAVESLHKFGFDDSQLQIETRKLELAARARGDLDDGGDEPDDGFLDALKGQEDWKEWNQEDEEEKTGI